MRMKYAPGVEVNGFRIIERTTSGGNPRVMVERIKCGHRYEMFTNGLHVVKNCRECPRGVPPKIRRLAKHYKTHYQQAFKNADEFIATVGESFNCGELRLIPRDQGKPLGPDNYQIVPRGKYLFKVDDQLVNSNQLAKRFGVSRQRINQVLEKFGFDTQSVVDYYLSGANEVTGTDRRKPVGTVMGTWEIIKDDGETRVARCIGCGHEHETKQLVAIRNKRCWVCKPRKGDVGQEVCGGFVITESNDGYPPFQLKCKDCGTERVWKSGISKATAIKCWTCNEVRTSDEVVELRKVS